MMEDALLRKKDPAVAENPKLGTTDDMEDMIREGCRLDVEA